MEQDNTSRTLLFDAEPQLTTISLATVVNESNIYKFANSASNLSVLSHLNLCHNKEEFFLYDFNWVLITKNIFIFTSFAVIFYPAVHSVHTYECDMYLKAILVSFYNYIFK